MEEESSRKSNNVALMLCFLIGFVGAHRFYVGKARTGGLMLVIVIGLGIWGFLQTPNLLMLVPVGLLLIWNLADFCAIVLQKFTDSEGKVLLFQ